MVSDICSSIRAPWVEMFSGATQVCRTMGIAEAIAITMMVTASNFAMSHPHFSTAYQRSFLLIPELRLLLRFESEIIGPRLGGSHGHFLGLSSVNFLPSCQRIVPWGNVVNGVSAVFIAHRSRPFHNYHGAMHPRMDIALDRNGDFH